MAPGGADPASPYDPADRHLFGGPPPVCRRWRQPRPPLRRHSSITTHSDAYVSLVLAYANEYSQMASGARASGGLGSVIVADTETYLGTPYVWGGENPRTGFDCSGLVQWVYAEAGISLPQVAQDQYDAGTPSPGRGHPLPR